MSRRSYVDGCATAHALDLIGDRWAMPVMRELLLGPKRFGDLRAALPGISANVLTQRLEELEAAAIVRRRKLPPPANVQVYELTEWGLESEELFKVIGRWASRSPTMQPGHPMSVASVVMSMRTMIDMDRVRGIEADVGFRFGEEGFRARLDDQGFSIARGETGDVDVLFDCDQNALAAAVYAGVPLSDLEAQGQLVLHGDRALAERFMRLFPLPDKAPAAGA